MPSERKDRNEVRELRLEGLGLFVTLSLLVAGLGGAFLLGRWYERSAAPAGAVHALSGDPLANVVEMEEPVDLADTANHFDTLGGAEKEAEPERQAQRATPPPRNAPAAQASGGPFFVQIVAVRDRQSAEHFVQRLGSEGYPVRLFSVADGSQTLYKVRVGGYGSQDQARARAQELVGKGYAGAWVTRID